MDDNINKYINQNNKKIITKKIDNSRKSLILIMMKIIYQKKIIFNEYIEINVKEEYILHEGKLFKNI